MINDHERITDYGEFVNELENRYDSIISTVAPIGQQLTNRLQTSPDDKLIIIAHDTLKRLICNIKVLKGIKINDDTCVAYRLILRVTTADLIECFYLLALPKDERDKEIWKKNLEGVRTLEIYASEKKKFFDKIHPGSVTDVDISDLHKKYEEYVDPNTKKFYSKKNFKKISTGDMIPTLIKDKSCAPEYEQLYINYRLLSLTEHYTTVARNHSYNLPFDHFFTIDVVRWIALISNVISDAIKEYLDTGTIVVEKVD